MSVHLSKLYDPKKLLIEYKNVRKQSENLCEPLEIEDFGLQVMADVSPPKWHLAHTTWFFETFLLKQFSSNYQEYHPLYDYLFNSYYNAIGQQFQRSHRGWLSRPTVKEVYEYRQIIDEKMEALINSSIVDNLDVQLGILLGIHHEQQHQELLLTDLKYSWKQNPILPTYARFSHKEGLSDLESMQFIAFEGGKIEMGYAGDEFSFDNERPRHSTWIEPFRLANRLVTNREYLAFIEDGGYQNASLWLSDGWSTLHSPNTPWTSPYYWQNVDGQWFEYSLNGLQELNLNNPVCHVSAYEADAFARWCGCSLPSEAQWEHAAFSQQNSQHSIAGNFVESGRFHPTLIDHSFSSKASQTIHQLFGDVWEWVSTSYAPYPGFEPFPDTMSEYNGKFMCNQLVLKGGSCVTPQSHIRLTYRNFFYPKDRWQFSGIRLSQSI